MNAQFKPARFKPAAFDRTVQHRRSMIAKINVARQQLHMDEDDYRQGLFTHTGQISLKTCSDAQLARMLDWLVSKGFRPLGKASGAQHPLAQKARALWISLHQLGVVHNPSEPALEAFACRQLKCEKLVWARQSDGFRLIEALKAMGTRKGWEMADPATGKHHGPLTLKANLCHAILARMKAFGLARADWALHDAAWKLCGIENARDTASDYETLAAGLGKVLRESGHLAPEASATGPAA